MSFLGYPLAILTRMRLMIRWGFGRTLREAGLELDEQGAIV